MNHLSHDLISRSLDDELTSAEQFECESHLAVCELCRAHLESLRKFSAEIEAAVLSIPVPAITGTRQSIQKAIEASATPLSLRHAALQHPGKVMKRFAWGMAIAATLAVGILIAPKRDVAPFPTSTQQSAKPEGSIEVDGETFTPVPFSNADLSASSPHIVQMQVPLSSLADAGIVLEPVSARLGSIAGSDRSVLADVLVGDDGQPYGIHVLAGE